MNGVKAGIPKLHPLIERNTSNFREQKFTTELTGCEFYLADHIVGGQKLLPGVACIEMARAAAELAGERKVQGVKNIAWLKPVAVDKGSREINISLYPDGSVAEYEIFSVGQGTQRMVHAQGVVDYESKSGGPSPYTSIDIDELKKKSTSIIDKEDFYKGLRQMGFDYGPSFQPVQRVYLNSTEVFAYLELPEVLLPEFHDFILHPVLMDGALHPVTVLKDSGETEAGMLYLPFMMGEVEIFKPLTKRCYSYVSLADEATAQSGLKKFNVRIMDEAGEVLVVISSFTTKAAGMKGNTTNNKKDSRILDIFQKLAEGNVDISQARRMMR